MKECCILGHGPTRIQWNYRENVEVFGVNNVYTFARKLDKLFIVDRITEAEFDFQALAQVKEIVASEPRSDHPEWKITVYPLQEILSHFKTTFFSNAICYMLAYALYYGYQRIWFAGIDMMTNTTYLFEKGGVEYWMGIAHAMGVPIVNTKDSGTGKTIDGKMYGYWGTDQDNTASFSKAIAEESKRLYQNLIGGVPKSEDPDGHLARKDEVVRKMLTQHPLPESLAEETRELVQMIPGYRDLSEEWVRGSNDNWVRREQRIVKT